MVAAVLDIKVEDDDGFGHVPVDLYLAGGLSLLLIVNVDGEFH
jgi:hypothetical protein